MMKGKMYLALPYNIDYSAGFYCQHSLLVNLVCLFHSGFEVQIHYYWSTVVSGLADESALLFFQLNLGAKYLVFSPLVPSKREKNVLHSFAQFVYFLREVCLLFNF